VRARVKIAVLAVGLLGLCPLAVPQEWALGPMNVPKPSAKARQDDGRIDINHASVKELMKASGMTRVWAERIVRYRPYRTKDDLLERGVVTDQVFERILDYIIAHRDK